MMSYYIRLTAYHKRLIIVSAGTTGKIFRNLFPFGFTTVRIKATRGTRKGLTMKVPAIDMSALAADMRIWGLSADFIYDDDEEGFVLHIGKVVDETTGFREVSMAPGFTYSSPDKEDRIMAYSDHIFAHQHDTSSTASANRVWIVANSRLQYYKKNSNEHLTLIGGN